MNRVVLRAEYVWQILGTWSSILIFQVCLKIGCTGAKKMYLHRRSEQQTKGLRGNGVTQGSFEFSVPPQAVQIGQFPEDSHMCSVAAPTLVVQQRSNTDRAATRTTKYTRSLIMSYSVPSKSCSSLSNMSPLTTTPKTHPTPTNNQ